MKFASFEEALHICVNAADGSPEQGEALQYCLTHAPADLRAMLVKRLGLAEEDGGHGHGCGCGCGTNHD